MTYYELVTELECRQRQFKSRMDRFPQHTVISISNQMSRDLAGDVHYMRHLTCDNDGRVKVENAVLKVNKKQIEKVLIFIE